MTFWSRFWNENCTPTFGYIPYIFSLFKQFRFSLHSHVAKALLNFNIGIVLQNNISFWPKFLLNFKIWFKLILDLKWNSNSKILTKELFSVFAPNFRHAGLMLCIVHHSCCSKFDLILTNLLLDKKDLSKINSTSLYLYLCVYLNCVCNCTWCLLRLSIRACLSSGLAKLVAGGFATCHWNPANWKCHFQSNRIEMLIQRQIHIE